MTVAPAGSSVPKGPPDVGSGDEPVLMEIAWEVCNQVGGIYTVLRSKVPSMTRRWGTRYCLVGPYNPKTAEVEFEPSPLVGAVGQAVEKLGEMGYRAHFGRWLVSGRPHTVLLEVESVAGVLDLLKYRTWSDHGIPCGDEATVNDAVAFGEMCRALLSAVAENERVVAHFHE